MHNVLNYIDIKHDKVRFGLNDGCEHLQTLRIPLKNPTDFSCSATVRLMFLILSEILYLHNVLMDCQEI